MGQFSLAKWHVATSFSSISVPTVIKNDDYYNNNYLSVRASKSHLTSPRWRGLDNGSTPVSRHITTRLRRVDENVDQAQLGGCVRLFPSLGVWGALSVWGGWTPAWGSALMVSWFLHWVSI